MIKFKQKDKEDTKLEDSDIKAFEDSQKSSWKEFKSLTKWESAVKLKVKQK